MPRRSRTELGVDTRARQALGRGGSDRVSELPGVSPRGRAELARLEVTRLWLGQAEEALRYSREYRRNPNARRWDTALLGDFTRLPVPERNLLFLFLHPRADPTCPNRKATVAELTAMLRAQVAAEPGHPRVEELIAGLTTSSAEFAELCGRHDVEEATRGQMRVIHPLVGELKLDWDAYPMPGAPGPVLIVCTAPEGSPDAERLQRLAGVLGQANTAPAPTRAN
ncbi:MAG: hypothetical protein ACRDN0_14010 [Trebonia sp.]